MRLKLLSPLAALLAVLLLATFAGVVAITARAVHHPSGSSDIRAAAERPRILRRGNGPEPESLDPHGARSESALSILRDLFEGLMQVGDDGTPVLAAADRVEVSSDGLTYRFHLRPDARWSNGEAVVAEDFAAAWRRLLDPRTAAQYADILSPVRGAVAILHGSARPETLGVRCAGEHTLIVELVQPTPYFLGILAHPATFPLNRPSLVAHGQRFTKPGVLVSNGAFSLTRWDFGSHLVAIRNDRYWNAAATQLDAVEYYSFPDATAELRAFRAGQVDITANVPAAQEGWIKAHLSASLHVAPQLAVYYLGLNLRRPPLESRALRQALSLVIDRERLVQAVTGGGEMPAYTFVSPATYGYVAPLPEYAAWPMPQRVARARQLLRDAKLAPGLLDIELSYNSGELHSRIAIAVAQMWKDALNINTTLRAEEFKVLLQDIERGDVGVFRASWIGDYNDAYSFLQVLRGGFGINMPHYASADYDALLQQASTDRDPASRLAHLQNAEALMLGDQPVIPLYFYVSKHLVDERVHGWRDNVMNIVYSKSLGKAVERR